MGIQGMPLNIVLKLAKEELMTVFQTVKVEILGVTLDYSYCGDFNDGAPLVVTSKMTDTVGSKKNCGKHPWLMLWDEDACGFHTIMRLDQNEEVKKEE